VYDALTAVIDGKEPIMDKYGREGTLVNIGSYYLFQPAGLEGHLTVFERSVPVDAKLDRIHLDLGAWNRHADTAVGRNAVEAQGVKIVAELRACLREAEMGREANPDMRNMDRVWYEFVPAVVPFVPAGIMSNLLPHMVAHFIDFLNEVDKIDLLNYIVVDVDVNADDVLHAIYDYFTNKMRKIKGITFIPFYTFAMQPVYVVMNEGNVWAPAEFLDEQEISAHLLRNPMVVETGTIVGVAGLKNNKKGEQQSLVFKIKQVTEKGAKGADCSASKDKFKVLNQLIAINAGAEIAEKAIDGKKACVLTELILRMMDSPSKRWFLNYEESLMSGVIAITKTVAAASMSNRV
jgi:hypothetical protein